MAEVFVCQVPVWWVVLVISATELKSVTPKFLSETFDKVWAASQSFDCVPINIVNYEKERPRKEPVSKGETFTDDSEDGGVRGADGSVR